MNTLSKGAAEAHAFNPQQWLTDFERCGGYWIVTDGRLASLGLYFDGNIEHEQRAAEALKALRETPEHLAAVQAHLAERA